MHQKVGILKDINGDIITFSGSNNESASGWKFHSEKFKVFCSWERGVKDYLQQDLDDFEELWANKSHKTAVIPFPEAVKNKLVIKAPRTDEEFKKLYKKVSEDLLKNHEEQLDKISQVEMPRELNLRNYQNTAVENWFKNDKKGFFQMATGTGKTETAIGVIKHLLKEEETLFVIVVVYGQSLLDQWIEKLRRYGYKSIGASSTFHTWRKEFRQKVTAVSLRYEKSTILVTTYQTFSSKDFIEIAEKITCNSLLICDEVHHAGAAEFRKGLIDLTSPVFE